MEFDWFHDIDSKSYEVNDGEFLLNEDLKTKDINETANQKFKYLCGRK